MEEREVVDSHGVKLIINPEIMSPRLQDVVRSGRLSHREGRGLTRIIEAGDRFVELGGGIGYTSTLAFQQGKAQSITTFEANPRLIPR